MKIVHTHLLDFKIICKGIHNHCFTKAQKAHSYCLIHVYHRTSTKSPYKHVFFQRVVLHNHAITLDHNNLIKHLPSLSDECIITEVYDKTICLYQFTYDLYYKIKRVSISCHLKKWMENKSLIAKKWNLFVLVHLKNLMQGIFHGEIGQFYHFCKSTRQYLLKKRL